MSLRGECLRQLAINFYPFWFLLMKTKILFSRTGDHSHNAIFGIFGSGCGSNGMLGQLHPEDIAPTVSYLLRVSLTNVDGCAIQALVP